MFREIPHCFSPTPSSYFFTFSGPLYKAVVEKGFAAGGQWNYTLLLLLLRSPPLSLLFSPFLSLSSALPSQVEMVSLCGWGKETVGLAEYFYLWPGDGIKGALSWGYFVDEMNNSLEEGLCRALWQPWGVGWGLGRSEGQGRGDEWVSEWVKVPQLCPTLCDPMDYTVHRILQARILEWVAFPFSRRIFPTQESNPVLPRCRWILSQLSHKGSLGEGIYVSYGWFTLLYGRNQHNIVKQYPPVKNTLKKRRRRGIWAPVSFLGGSDGQESASNAGDRGSILGWKDPLGKEMAIHSSILAWRTPWTEKLGRLHTVHGVAKSQTRLSSWCFLNPNNHQSGTNSFQRFDVLFKPWR